MSIDATRDEMLTLLATYDDYDEFDREEAIYWFANDYHGGQGSELYSALSTSPYSPGPLTNAPSDPFLYGVLEHAFA